MTWYVSISIELCATASIKNPCCVVPLFTTLFCIFILFVEEAIPLWITCITIGCLCVQFLMNYRKEWEEEKKRRKKERKMNKKKRHENEKRFAFVLMFCVCLLWVIEWKHNCQKWFESLFIYFSHLVIFVQVLKCWMISNEQNSNVFLYLFVSFVLGTDGIYKSTMSNLMKNETWNFKCVDNAYTNEQNKMNWWSLTIIEFELYEDNPFWLVIKNSINKVRLYAILCDEETNKFSFNIVSIEMIK